MRAARLTAPVLLAILAVSAQADPIAAHGEQEEMRRQVHERAKIARILAADNVEPGRLTPNEVAALIRAIPRGGAPEDFWSAYQAHVRAWERAAATDERLRALAAAGKPIQAEERFGEIIGELISGQRELAATFAEVGRIAEAYGVSMPIPPAEAAITI